MTADNDADDWPVCWCSLSSDYGHLWAPGHCPKRPLPKDRARPIPPAATCGHDGCGWCTVHDCAATACAHEHRPIPPGDDDEFGQCPHEVARLTCGRGGCSCPCDPCAPYRPIPPGVSGDPS
jgi:hypothetical protein